jgi:hypothetical protein
MQAGLPLGPGTPGHPELLKSGADFTGRLRYRHALPTVCFEQTREILAWNWAGEWALGCAMGATWSLLEASRPSMAGTKHCDAIRSRVEFRLE